MDKKLFLDTLRLINGCFPKNQDITEDTFLYYLLGYTYTSPETDNDKYLLTLADTLDNFLDKNDTLRNILGNQYSNILSENQNLTLKTLVKITLDRNPKAARDTEKRLLCLQKELLDLCKEYSLPCTDSENAEVLFSRLFTACITEPESPSPFTACITETEHPSLFVSQKKRQLKPTTIEGTLGRLDDSSNLCRCLNQYHKIVISGQSGSGKSRFIQYCLSTWKLPDYCYVSYDSDLETTKKAISSFINNADKLGRASLDDLKNKTYASSLLVIDQMDDSENFVKELTELASYAINIIVVTNTDVTLNTFYTFRLSTLTDDTLKIVFEHSSGISLDDNNRGLLFRISQKNILLISLIAGQCKQAVRQSTGLSEEKTEILHQLLTNLDNTLSSHLPNANHHNLTFKHPYDKKALDLLGHIKLIYASFAAKYKETALLRRTMRFLCCFGYSEIPLSFLKLFPEYDQQALDTLSDMGWILKTNVSVQLPSLIARSVFAYEVPSATDCFEMIDKMTDFLRNYDQTLRIPYLANTLLTFACSMNAKVKKKNNPCQKHASSEFESWQELIYLIYNYYQENGDFMHAEKIIGLINDGFINCPDISSKHNHLDTYIFQFTTHMSQQSWLKKIPEEGSKLMMMIENDERLIQTTCAPLLVSLMDNSIYLYCSCLFSYYNAHISDTKYKEIIDYHPNLINAVGTILHLVPPPRLNMKPKLSAAQYEYYQLCYKLMISGKHIFSTILEPIISENAAILPSADNPAYQLLKENNANYKIRGIAFTMFMRSLYRTDKQINQLLTIDSSIFEKLILAIRCDINKLNNLITACEQIPWHTTWSCLFCYLQLIKELSALCRKSNRGFSIIYYSFILKSLLCRSTFTEEQLKEAYNKITPYFPL